MTDLVPSDADLDRFRLTPKRVANPGARWNEKPGRHRQRNFNAQSDDGTSFRIYQRQNLDDERDFSCGLAIIRRGRKTLSLIRYNGSSHVHGEIRYRCHIHRATARALSAGKKADSHAEETDRYRTLEGALACLIDECRVQGLTAQHDGRDLFDGS